MAAVQKRKIRLAISLFLVMLYFSGLTAQAQYGGGSGEPNDPYLIYTAEQMNAIGADANDWNKHFKLMADIDLSAYTGTDFNMIGYYIDYYNNKPFTGVFDGNGHTISNFSYTSTDREYIGLFGRVGTWEKHAVIKDLGLIDPNVDAGTGRRVGSLVGYNLGTITNCYVEGGSVSGGGAVGGLVGGNWVDSTITNCYSTVSVSGTSDVGGLVGGNYGTITNCYAQGGSVSGEDAVGGLVGRNAICCPPPAGTITKCYSTVIVSGTSDVGGLVGTNEDGSFKGEVTNSFWDIETSGQSTSSGGTGLTTAELMDPYMLGLNGFANDPNWVLDDGRDYPRLAWEGTAGQIIPEPIIDWLEGHGTDEYPYHIDTHDQLILLGKASILWDNHFVLGADIDLDPNLPGRCVFGKSVIQHFTGVFDGNGHMVANLTIVGGGNRGLFGELGSQAMISNLGLEAVDVNGTGWYVGGLVGALNSGATITNCYSTGSVSGNSAVGGLVGWNGGIITDCYSTGSVSGNYEVGGLVGYNSGIITNCYSSGNVSGYRYVGGLVGWNEDGSITNCYSTVSVSGGDSGVGGLVGRNYEGTITDCYSTGSVSGSGYTVGGLVGENSGTISNCYSTASVGSYVGAGGLVGFNWYGTITNCYSAGNIWGNEDVGGLVGGNYGTITNCYSVGSVTGTTDVGGLIGHHRVGTVSTCFWDIETSGLLNMCGSQSNDATTGCDDSYGKTTAEMKTANTFLEAGWDFVDESINGTEDIWSICEGTNYPRLVWQIPAGDFVCPDGITIEDFVFFAEYWGNETCDLSNDYCQGTDLDFSGTVDEADLEILVENWLAGSELEN